MKHTVRLISIITLILSIQGCEVIDDPIPEGSALEVPILSSEIIDANTVRLSWGASRLCAGWNCVPWVDASMYEVFQRFPGNIGDRRIASLNPDEKVFDVVGLEVGKPYEFFIKAKRARTETSSNRIMVAPNHIGTVSKIFGVPNSAYIFTPQISPKGNLIAYNGDFSADSADFVRGQNIYLYDLGNQRHTLVKENSFEPSWSLSGEKLLLSTSKGLPFFSQGYRPKHIEIFDLGSKTFEKVVGNDSRNSYPVFDASMASVFYLSDSLEKWNDGIWETTRESQAKRIWLPKIESPGIGQTVYSGLAHSFHRDYLAFNSPYRENGDGMLTYNILGFDHSQSDQVIAWVESPWNDLFPSFSPFRDDLMAFISNRSGTNQVWIKNLETAALVQASNFGSDIYIGYAGSALSWGDGGDSIYLSGIKIGGGYEMIKLEIGNLAVGE